jgi:hypothetical protein
MFPEKKPYSTPELRRLNREQSALFLLGHDWDGDSNAKELLQLVFPDFNDGEEKSR